MKEITTSLLALHEIFKSPSGRRKMITDENMGHTKEQKNTGNGVSIVNPKLLFLVNFFNSYI